MAKRRSPEPSTRDAKAIAPRPRPILRPGATGGRRYSAGSQAHPGVSALHAMAHRDMRFQPLPRPLGAAPYHYALADAMPDVGKQMASAKRAIFHVIGDSGGIQNGQHQIAIAEQMIQQASRAQDPVHFCYHVGDVVYYTGMHDDYYQQFYDPYSQYTPPILAIPGNHDGEVDDPAAQTSLDGWIAYFMQEKPDVDPVSKDAPRIGLNLPNVYWTLETPYATIVGMYTNVPEGGSVDSVQQQWLTNEFATAPADRALILALHHPLYSFDVFRSGSARMADVVENAIRDTRRVPNLVLAGHVHDYKRIEKSIAAAAPTPFIVIGNCGYPNLHALHSPVGTVAQDTQAKLVAGQDKAWTLLTLEVDADVISGATIDVDSNGNATDGDKFSYTAEAVMLKSTESLPSL